MKLETQKDAGSIEQVLLQKYSPEEALAVLQMAENRVRQIQGKNVGELEHD